MYNFDFDTLFPNHKKTDFHKPEMGKKGVVIAFILTFILFLLVQYVLMIPMTWKNPTFLVQLAFFFALFVGLSAGLTASLKKYQKVMLGIAGLMVAYVVIGSLLSTALFHASSFQSQLVVDDQADFYKDNASITFDQIPVVDRESAMRLGDRKMGEIMDYVSQFDVSDDYNQINYQGRPTRVTPLQYSGLVKWFNNFQDGLPAYIKVDMVSQEVEVVRLDDGMKYSESDKFFRNIHRYLFVNYPSLMFDTLSFEVDEQGIPHYIAPVYEYKIGFFGGKDIVGAVLVNAVNGDHQYYDISEVPSWVDRVYPEELVMTQLENWGKYTNGFWNTYFGQKGMLRPTDGYNYITIDDDVYFYTGLTSVMADQSNVGFALINLRTKEAKFYNIPGAEENSAMQSAQGQVQHLGYTATFPILINSGGTPTYFMALKDGASLVKMYAFVSVENYNIVGTGESVAEAQEAYYNALAASGQAVSDEDLQLEETTGAITDIASVVVEGNSQYYFEIEGHSQIFMAPIEVSHELPLLHTGDVVTVTYTASESRASAIRSIELVNEEVAQ